MSEVPLYRFGVFRTGRLAVLKGGAYSTEMLALILYVPSSSVSSQHRRTPELVL